MFEILIGSAAVQVPPKPELVLVPSTEFITGTALTTLVGLNSQPSPGTLMAWGDTTPWVILRDTQVGKVFAIPQKPLRYATAFNSLVNCGAHYGKNVIIQGATWQVHSFSGLSDTTSEWALYMHGIAQMGAIQPGKKRFASYTFDELGIGDTNTANQGVNVYIREEYNQYQYYTRGNKNNLTSLYNQNKDNFFNTNGWRPILELVSGTQPWV
jgi:hypothetical protein